MRAGPATTRQRQRVGLSTGYSASLSCKARLKRCPYWFRYQPVKTGGGHASAGGSYGSEPCAGGLLWPSGVSGRCPRADVFKNTHYVGYLGRLKESCWAMGVDVGVRRLEKAFWDDDPILRELIDDEF